MTTAPKHKERGEAESETNQWKQGMEQYTSNIGEQNEGRECLFAKCAQCSENHNKLEGHSLQCDH